MAAGANAVMFLLYIIAYLSTLTYCKTSLLYYCPYTANFRASPCK